MKSFLIFLKSGEIQEKKTGVNVFDIAQFKQFEMYKVYHDYLVMYNNSNISELNLTVLNFTTDRYNSDIGLIKLEGNLNIKSLTLNSYTKILERERYEKHEEDTDVLDIAESYRDIISF
tara:strand:+ start:5869 stop:6225 length:357 start_codon:yes stop_codon:yes gene_type:complete